MTLRSESTIIGVDRSVLRIYKGGQNVEITAITYPNLTDNLLFVIYFESVIYEASVSIFGKQPREGKIAYVELVSILDSCNTHGWTVAMNTVIIIIMIAITIVIAIQCYYWLLLLLSSKMLHDFK